jgi:ribosomal protein S18 acetylase RimI-like enzyme
MALPKAEIREATVDDALVLSLVGAATCLESYAGMVPGAAVIHHASNNHTPASYIAHLSKPQTRAWIAEVAPGSAPVGFAFIGSPNLPADLIQPGDVELKRIYVFSRFHGTGIGFRLMQLAIDSARAQGAKHLMVGAYSGNVSGIAFYKRVGFVQIGTREFVLGSETFLDPVFALTL